ncbi:hypothetical protein LY78DRAFT_702364 [Colletotrichum sublineola]|nr:hypothetical protein LY78DRAFT_702364 [Colletotrichum sublineola]
MVRELDDISVLFASGGRKWKLTAHEYSATILSLGYRLLQVRDQGLQNLDAMQDACLLGLMCFYSSLLLQLGRQRHLVYATLSCQLKASVDGLISGCRHPRLPSTIMWLLMIGAISVLEKEEDVWLLPALARVSGMAGLKGWEETCKGLKEYPWIGSIHDGQGERVWERVQRYQLDTME